MTGSDRWQNMVDLHVHAAPSLMPRHHGDADAAAAAVRCGFGTIVLKCHEGASADRAAIASVAVPGVDVLGGVALNSSVGGANPDAVEVCHRLGGRVVWMPTMSAANHLGNGSSSELSVHRHVRLAEVAVTTHGELLPEWLPVLDLVAQYDMVLASGHLAAAETVVLFREAKRRGVRRLLVNHPKMPFIGWNDGVAAELRHLGAHLELGILPDRLGNEADSSIHLARDYPHSLLVFGGDLGHRDHPPMTEALAPWLSRLEAELGAERAHDVMSTNGARLLA